MMKLIIVFIIWSGCLLPYLASTRQQLINKALPKSIAWAGFSVLQLASIIGLSQYFHPITASLIVLMFVMCMWVGLIIISSHLSTRTALVCTIAIAFFSLITLTGASNVA